MQGIVLKSQIPLRAEKSHRSEMVSQLLFGESYTVLDKIDNWYFIKTNFDNYIGWIDEISFDELISEYNLYTVSNKFLKLIDENDNHLIIPAGSMIPKPNNNSLFTINNKIYKIDDELLNSSNIIESAKLFISSPYLWGGRTFMGFDCSGFVQIVYKMNNISIPRDASEQIKFGNSISIIQEAHEGDLVFFGNEDSITHVGILIDSE
ncbi:C40 family peptidase, partial [Odoribacter sp. OttesenSCG-928-L07]|nr:C40 family peptidase [Odoribacter sp. OttesenSCG-928-L07]